MQGLLAAIRRCLLAIRPPGRGAATGDPLAGRDIALIVASGLLVMTSAPALFLQHITAIDPAWPGASPLMLYLIAVGRALGTS